ncbi:hypothetical protein TRIATDRAFT_300218 [Trichoderma atroviride IMI 206040]|uniref:Uncharacterized protein n=1 Tax=Hypocrea atroviridis (strain ATCC 20476 / IMI 206040) TaxID=452589 RepID=G9NZ72_HYPAI|nr:uncharacterized protein TRIATDRAFT_300218 [Trichoderma atroviride IMI 206040]EHK43788.1 hypothetical protein TRIATDRAFT_300218 [Trichoderma atroviride IMI 206040]
MISCAATSFGRCDDAPRTAGFFFAQSALSRGVDDVLLDASIDGYIISCREGVATHVALLGAKSCC